jgi:hypothetical protein
VIDVIIKEKESDKEEQKRSVSSQKSLDIRREA